MESKHQQAERQASEWLTQRDSGLWSEGDRAALDRWLDESPINAVAFIRLEAAWKKADRYKALGAGFPQRKVPTPDQVSRSPFFDEPAASLGGSRSLAVQRLIDEEEIAREYATPPQARRRSAEHPTPIVLAACLLAAAALGFMGHLLPHNRAYSTPVGGTTSVPMQDGSRVTLNTDSEMKVALTDTERRVQLDRGEAFFEVAKDARRPFVVDAGSKRIVVLGTEFSVRREGGNVSVAVTEGKVRLEDLTPRLNERARPGGGESFTLDAGGVAHAGGEGVLVQSKPISDVLDAMSWRSGFVVFRNVDLAEAIAEFNRYSEKKIVIQDPALAAIRLSGKFKATNFDAFVRLLEEGYPVEARATDSGIVLTERTR